MTAAAQLRDPSVYVPPESPWDLRLRSNTTFKAALMDLVRLWQLYAEARGDDAEKIDMAHVVRSTLEQAVDVGFAQFGGRPKTEEQWQALAADLAKAVKAASKQR